MKRIIESPNTSTIFSLENASATWFVDYNEVDVKAIIGKPYCFFVSKDETPLKSFETFGEALAYIFEKQGTTRFQALSVEIPKLPQIPFIDHIQLVGRYEKDNLYTTGISPSGKTSLANNLAMLVKNFNLEMETKKASIQYNYIWTNPENSADTIEVLADTLTEAKDKIIWYSQAMNSRLTIEDKDIKLI